MKRCLVVDDSDVIRKVARRILESMQIATEEADNGQEAIERCQADPPDAILLDWHMPVMNGVEFLSALRLSRIQRKPFVIYCTTENDPADIARAFAAGADEYLLKPFSSEELKAKLADIGLA
jgi:two-component system, chemotaxis family, chemotaxis protein CheY